MVAFRACSNVIQPCGCDLLDFGFGNRRVSIGMANHIFHGGRNLLFDSVRDAQSHVAQLGHVADEHARYPADDRVGINQDAALCVCPTDHGVGPDSGVGGDACGGCKLRSAAIGWLRSSLVLTRRV